MFCSSKTLPSKPTLAEFIPTLTIRCACAMLFPAIGVDMKIQKATCDDIPSILKIQQELLLDPDHLDDPENRSRSGFLIHRMDEAHVKNIIDDPHSIVLIAQDNDETVGYLLSNPASTEKHLTPLLSEQKDTLYLNQIGVLEKAKGVGVKLEIVFFNEAKKMGYKHIAGEVLESPIVNQASLDFHTSEKVGFCKIGNRQEGNLRWGIHLKQLYR